MTKYQKAFLKLLKKAYNEIKGDFKELIEELSLSFEDIAAVTYVESSFSADSNLCISNANPFQMYEAAFMDAIAQAKAKRIDYSDVQAAYLAYLKPECTADFKVSIDFHKRHIKGALKMFLLYIWRIFERYKERIPNLKELTLFERVMLVYFLGLRCAKKLEGKSNWDEAASLCIGSKVSPSLYIKRLREGREKVKEFFRE